MILPHVRFFALAALAAQLTLPRAAAAQSQPGASSAGPADAGPAAQADLPDGGTPDAEDGEGSLSATVNGDRVHGSYITHRVNTARTDTPIVEQPMEIQVIPSEVMEDQASYTMKQLMHNVSGVAPDKTEGYAAVFEGLIVRGFLSQSIYQDGFENLSHGVMPLEMAERVEVVKGPASMLYGQVAPGGFVNIVTKKPSMDPSASLHGSLDRFGAWNLWADGTGGVETTNAGSFSGRIVGGYDRNWTFRDGDSGFRSFAAPSLTWSPSQRTELTVLATYTRQRQALDDGVPFINKQPVIPIDTFLNDASYPGMSIIDSSLDVLFRQTFNEHVEWHSRFRYGFFHNDLNAIRLVGVPNAAGLAPITLSDNHAQDESTSIQNDVQFKFNTGFLRHKATLGVDFFHIVQLSTAALTPTGTVNIYDPTQRSPIVTTEVPASHNNTHVQQFGVFALEELSAGARDQLHVVGGLRYDNYATDAKSGTTTITHKRLEQDALTWRVGALYELLKDIGPYASAATSFAPVSPTTQTYQATPLNPETALQYEIGGKAGLFDNRLLFTGCWFLLTKNDAVVTDIAHPGFSLNGGRIHSGGVEADVVGTPLPGLNLIGSFTDLRTKVLSSNVLPVGGQLRDTPKVMTSLWAKYTLQGTFLRGLGFGAGIMGATGKEVDDANSFLLPGYVTVDATASYLLALDGHKATIQVNVTNLTNTVYYESSITSGRIMPGRPIDAIASFHVQF